MLKLKNVSKDYFDFEFELKNISFNLEEGYIMGLVGKNGSGKTTIINLIMNSIRPTGGSIEIFGKENTLSNNAYIKDNIGFVFDNSVFPEHLNLEKMGYIFKKMYSKFDDDYYEYLIEKLKISKLKKFKDLSKGQLMKVQIILALSHNAKLIIMDEPSAGLDPVIRRELLKILREYREKTNAAVLFSSHITEDLEELADYITLIDNGQLIFSKDIESIREEYKIIKCPVEESKTLNKENFLGYEEDEILFTGLISNKNITDHLDELVTKDASIQDILYYSMR